MKFVKSFTSLTLALVLIITCSFSASAVNGQVTYSGDAGEFIFAPGSEYSATDLFPDLKDVMPGGSYEQQITVRNEASRKVKVKIYMRSLGAHEDSQEFLSKLNLRVEKTEDTVMFDAPANETAGLTEWTYLGLLYSGGETDLKVILDVPTSLDNENKSLIGYLDWEFMVEEFPAEPTDPRPPMTGDFLSLVPWIITFGASAAILAILIILIIKRRKKEDEE